MSSLVETVVLLTKLKSDDYINVELYPDELDATKAETKATYKQIQEYVLETTGLKVSSLFIAQTKRKHGLEMGENYNHAKSGDAKVPICPSEKEKAIEDALRHFRMI